MMSSSSTSIMLSQKIPKPLPWWMLSISILGFLDAAYLTLEHFLNRVPPCSIVAGCEQVTTSVYSIVAGVPVALLGAVYYLFVLMLVIVYLDTKNEIILRVVARLTIIGFVASLAFVYIQLFVIGAICLYCMFSALTSTTLFVLGMQALSRMKRPNHIGEVDLV